jgi:hypothetical protein
MSWYLAPSLRRLRDEVNHKWPNRSTASDGTIGDPAHASRDSDHNPNRRDSVNAIDITNDGINVDALIAAVIRHPSTAYVISRGVIRSRTYGWVKRPYGGDNPHDHHVHISIEQSSSAEQSTRSWLNGDTFPLADGHSFGTPRSTSVHDGTEGPVTADNVRRIQRRLGIKQTGRYGLATKAKVAAWQVWKRIPATGRVGAVTWKRLGL